MLGAFLAGRISLLRDDKCILITLSSLLDLTAGEKLTVTGS
jgi:hypothetical protein